jgi:Methylamine utilisation protein MauE
VTVPAVSAPYLAAALMLVCAGVAKLARPDDTTRAVRAAGIPASRSWVRAGAGAEAAIGVAAIASPGPVTAALLAASYAAFAGFVVAALVRGWPLSSCGCFGKADTRPTAAHAAMNIGATAAALWWAAHAPNRPVHLFLHQPWHGAPLALVAAVIALLAYLVWTNPLETSS